MATQGNIFFRSFNVLSNYLQNKKTICETGEHFVAADMIEKLGSIRKDREGEAEAEQCYRKELEIRNDHEDAASNLKSLVLY